MGQWVNGSWIMGDGYVTQDPFRILMSLCPVLTQLTHHLCHCNYTYNVYDRDLTYVYYSLCHNYLESQMLNILLNILLWFI